jgi:hypothetical protein
MNDPAVLLGEAHTNLDLTSNAVAHGANAAPDLVMRVVIATRDRLNRHQPEQRADDKHVCGGCGRSWPCPDVLGDFSVLGVDPEDEY